MENKERIETQSEKKREIPEQWERTPEYEKFKKLIETWKKEEAEKIRIETMKKLIEEELKIFLDSYKSKIRQDMVKKEMMDLPLEFKNMIANLNIRIKNELPKEKSQKDISKINDSILWFVQSVAFKDWKSTYFAKRILKYAPELENTEIMKLILELGQSCDIIATEEEKQRQIEEETQKIEEETKKWEEIIKMLKSN